MKTEEKRTGDNERRKKLFCRHHDSLQHGWWSSHLRDRVIHGWPQQTWGHPGGKINKAVSISLEINGGFWETGQNQMFNIVTHFHLRVKYSITENIYSFLEDSDKCTILFQCQKSLHFYRFFRFLFIRQLITLKHTYGSQYVIYMLNNELLN